MEGEAYFDVATNGNKAFIVFTDNLEIIVTGTEFNVMAYNDEENTVTTLIHGKVKVNSKNSEQLFLLPGYQAILDNSKNIITRKKVDTNIYTAWRDGRFVFEHENLESIMRKLARWYNVDIDFQNDKTRNLHFTGKLQRYEEISEILSMIELTTNIKLKYLIIQL